MAIFFRGQKGDSASYKQDYSNIGPSIDISAEEFKDLIELNFDNLTTTIVDTTDFNNKKTRVCFTVEEKDTDKTVIYNKGFICVKEATNTEEGMVVGIHDMLNYKAYFKKSY